MNLSEKIRFPRLSSLARGLWAAHEGMVAVEFALIAPLMITIYFGVNELTDALEARAKVTAVVSSAGDLVAQEKTVCDAEMTDIFAALNALMFPYPANTDLRIIITSLVDGGNGLAKVVWSDAQNTTPRLANSTIADLPAGLIDANGSVIMTEVTYSYTNPTGQWLHGAISMTDKFYSHPRKVSQVARSATSC
jgi:Flp pilus assembly protein TadG